jgi:hypothetical protein
MNTGSMSRRTSVKEEYLLGSGNISEDNVLLPYAKSVNVQ